MVSDCCSAHIKHNVVSGIWEVSPEPPLLRPRDYKNCLRGHRVDINICKMKHTKCWSVAMKQNEWGFKDQTNVVDTSLQQFSVLHIVWLETLFLMASQTETGRCQLSAVALTY